MGLGIDMTKEPIPVVPAQHYTCGGIMIDLAGRTDLPGLYAAGECTESGLHGANRLASNSLLECFVFGEAAAADILDHWDAFDAPPPVLAWDESRVSDSDEEVIIKQNWTEIRRFMWNYVGIQRSTKRLERAAHRIKMLFDEVEDYYGHFRVSTDLIELRNLLQSADLIVRSALKRHESRGLHCTRDYPQTLDEAVDTVLVPKGDWKGEDARVFDGSIPQEECSGPRAPMTSSGERAVVPYPCARTLHLRGLWRRRQLNVDRLRQDYCLRRGKLGARPNP
jgi:L-aspartate oxidase